MTGSQNGKNYFRGFRGDVDSDDDDDGLTEQRLEQWRPFSQNPFISPDLGLAPENSHPQPLVGEGGANDEKALEKPDMKRTSTDFSQQHPVSLPSTMTHAGPTWVNLFYDLAWTASFASLTQNGQLNEPWDTVSYIAFFLVVWWLWASQTLYSVHFYTNDWVHLLSIFAQLIIFGLLAATTRGYDVTAYIMHSPGISTLDLQSTISDIVDPDRYSADRVAEYSLRVIALTLAISRTLLWAQHLLVLHYARRTARKQNLVVPRKLYVLPIGLSISNALFWAAMQVNFSSKGKTIGGAKLKFIFWGVGLLAEVLLHLLMEHLSWQPTSSEPVNEPTDAQNVSQDTQQLPELEGITTVILGEGINGIAGTLYAVISAPGLGGPVATNIACAAIIVYFLAYFYFEGPTGRRDPKGSRVRQMIWLLLHFPFMLSIIYYSLSYLSTAEKTFRTFDEVMSAQDLYLDDPGSANNLPIKNFLLKRGLKWAEEFGALNASVTDNGTIPLAEVSEDKLVQDVAIWYNQIYLKIMVKLYETFMGGNEKIAPEVQTMINQYYNNATLVLEDLLQDHELASSYHYETILTKLLEANLLGARYITGLAAVILISLGVMNRFHSKPRDPALDRFQWGIIFTRFVMGFALLLLLLLNIGHYQSLWVYEGQEGQQAGVFLWIWAWWVLPTVTLAYVAEFMFEAILLRCAGLAIARKRGRVSGPLWRLFFRKPLSWSRQAK
ncbi:low temperature requirement protein LtrA [Rhizoctonia solani AG-3 Rhs1AP]|uniref:Low temperature requirement protein LtrA n=2 Tax=Rhizoctonia solani AG-3 TaxID=1086053 RepID=A0A074RWN0_9AGAM|nr:low temperature requirement protein LtrA [Rhizoctonia solani AG-3 Rhs1AP]KEP51526.1 low temperature requirement protein LtrA [Rhizoctonia solani 123E]